MEGVMRPLCTEQSVLAAAGPRNQLFFPINIDRITRAEGPRVYHVSFTLWARATAAPLG